MMELIKIREFYNNFSESQYKTGVNDRIAYINNRLAKIGLNKYSRVLELGCGIGVLSAIIVKKVKKGYLEAVDISPLSIELLKKRIKKGQNFNAVAADIVTYTPQNSKFDFITLFDVIEHVPIELHDKLFKKISQYIGYNTKLLINIPSAYNIKYTRKTKPELLQIVDQEINLDLLIQNLTKNNLAIETFETYSLWKKDDYQFFIIEINREFNNEDLFFKLSLLEKIKRKLIRVKLNRF